MSKESLPAKDPAKAPQLSSEYKSVQQRYLLIAAGLAFAPLFGAEIDPSKWGLKLNNPNALTYVLLLLLVYHCCKLIIEWKECDQLCRQRRASLIDFWGTHLAAVIAVLMTLQQYVAKLKFGGVATRHPGWVAFLAFVSLILASLLFLWYGSLERLWMKIVGAVPLLAMFATAVVLLIYTVRVAGPASAALALVLGLAPFIVMIITAGAFLTVFTLVGLAKATRVMGSDSEDSPGPSPFDALGQ